MRRLATTLVLATAVALTAAVPAEACNASKRRKAVNPPSGGRPALVIGDSVMLGAADRVAQAGFEVDAKGCRQMSAGLDIIRARARSKSLPHLVIVGLGTNGSVSLASLQTASKLLGPDRVLGVITPRELGGGSGGDATTVRRYAAAHPGRVVLVDWVKYSAGHGGWFAGDGIHLGSGGAQGMTRLLRTTRQKVGPVLCP